MVREPGLEPSLLTAQELIAWRRGGVPRVPEAVILTHQESIFSALAPRLRAKKLLGLFPQVRVLPGTDERIVLAGRIGLGGPATAMAVEELAAAGAMRIVMVDVAASITKGCVAANAMVVQDALSADGTSRQYLPEGQELVSGDTKLSERLLVALQAGGGDHYIQKTSRSRVASVDAPFRETATLLDGFRARDVSLVDMETAALFAAAKACNVAAASVLVVGDQLLEVWQPPTDAATVKTRLQQIAGVVRGVLLT